MRALHDVLKAWKPAAIPTRDPIAAVIQAWPEIVGEKIAANSRPHQIERDTLVIVTRSNAWSQQLSFLGEHILHALNERRLQPAVTAVRFRVGKLTQVAARRPPSRTARPSSTGSPKERSAPVDLHEAIARFRSDIEAEQRAKQGSGWKHCSKCGALVAPSSQEFCSTCADARMGEREALVERLLYETPWLGYEGVVPLAAGLTRAEYTKVRNRLLARWWEILRRAQHAGRLSPGGRERFIASSYVLLKSGIAPDAIAPATVRNVLGDALHDLIYGSST